MQMHPKCASDYSLEPTSAQAQARMAANRRTLVVALLCAATLWLDLKTPIQLELGVLYLPLVCASMFYTRLSVAYIFAAIGSVLIMVTYVVNAPPLNAVNWTLLVNRLLSIAGLWLIAGVIYYSRRERRRREESEENFRTTVMNTVPDGLITIDGQGVVRTLNVSGAKIFGYTPEEVVGRHVKMLLPDTMHAEYDEFLKSFHAVDGDKKVGGTREMLGRRKDGTVFPIDVGMNATQFCSGQILVGLVRDVSRRKRAEESVQRYVEALKRSNQELDDFAYIASHDLKEPLRGLSNNATFLIEDFSSKLGEEGQKRLKRMTYLCQRMERLVNDLLYFSRLGRQDLAVQSTNLNEMIEDIEAMLETSLHDANATIKIVGTLPTITCDLPRITEVFRNLITNAIKYNDKPEKRVEIGCEIKDDQRVFFVRDNGIGIPSQFYDDVFRIFKRLNEEDDGVKGTGVGLTFVKKIIERHNGSIWVESKVGEGTSFYFTINSAEQADMYERTIPHLTHRG